MTKYKNSRRKVTRRISNTNWYSLSKTKMINELCGVVDDLLATVPEKKCEQHNETECVVQLPERLGGKQLRWKLKSEPTPPQLPEIKPIDSNTFFDLCRRKDYYLVLCELRNKQCELIDRINILSKRV